jgi:hypothetical protein
MRGDDGRPGSLFSVSVMHKLFFVSMFAHQV